MGASRSRASVIFITLLLARLHGTKDLDWVLSFSAPWPTSRRRSARAERRRGGGGQKEAADEEESESEDTEAAASLAEKRMGILEQSFEELRPHDQGRLAHQLVRGDEQTGR